MKAGEYYTYCSVHDLSPFLWHALDVWRCTNHLSGWLSEAFKALSHCGMGLVSIIYIVITAIPDIDCS